ncbi:hypothetical protein RHGRI_022121 [Rhododendron griersonianum]|uniref:RING-type domain-containing protein n=1 Tax=Rhododendron griersonianum TaxID=479676 RepID=A0AAV6JR15_9ERIC|nr:hypothetical protein RHGRI_022121 [Rhododendron griersonianum]
MEVCTCPNIPLRAWSSFVFPCGVSGDRQRRIEYISSVVSAVLSNLFYAILICLFGVVWGTLGAMTALVGAVFGLKSRRGLLHGAAAGAYFYLLFFKASAGLWMSFADGPSSFLHLIVVISRLVNPALLYLGELIGSVGNQMGTVQSINEVQRSISTRGAKEPSRRSVDRLSKTRITDQNIYDDSGNRISCPICLEDFQHGEVAGILSLCHHMFHQPCIGKWCSRSSSCPLCRRNK